MRGERPLGMTEGTSSGSVFIISSYPVKMDSLDILFCQGHEGRTARVSPQEIQRTMLKV